MSASLGTLRARVTLERPTLAPDELGGERRAFDAVAHIWARLEPIGAGGVRVSWRIAIRTRRDVRPGWRVACAGRRYVVRAVVDADETATRVHLYCEEDLP
jgi:SPP1 family predicted phage head-tail adaptor